MKPVRNNVFLTLGVFVLVLVFQAGQALACDSCNRVFGAEMEGDRANSLIGKDFLKAAKNQGNLLDNSGLGSGAFKPTVVKEAEEKAAASVADEAKAADTPAEKPTDNATATPTPRVRSVESPMSGSVSRSSFAAMSGQSYGPVPEEWKNDPFIEIIERDYGLDVPPTSYVPQDTKPDKSFTIVLNEGKAYIGNGVVYDGFLTNNTVPGPLFIMEEGDIVEFIIENDGTVPHGASIHAAYTQTSKYLGKINPGARGRVVFRAVQPGVFMYHCAPGGHAIPMHVMFGQYGMMVVKPKNTLYELEKRTGHKPDIEIYMIQHEFYASGKDAVDGHALYTTFNGKLFRYVEDPIKARPGDFVRIYFINVGPNLLSTFHIVGILWDYVYWQGNPAMAWAGGQSVTAGPTDSFVIDFRVPPDEGAYTILTHAVGSASRGAIGLLVAEKDIERPSVVRPEGLDTSPEEMAEIEKQATRIVSPFRVTEFDKAQTYLPGTKKVDVSIIGNSYWPKVIEVEPGTEVVWTNDDVFTFLAGEFSGVHNAFGNNGAGDSFSTPLLAHGEKAGHVFDQEGVYDYSCQPHPYMKGRIIVKKPDIDLSNLVAGKTENTSRLLPLAFGAFLVALFALFRSLTRREP